MAFLADISKNLTQRVSALGEPVSVSVAQKTVSGAPAKVFSQDALNLASQAPPAKAPFTVATYNLKDFFDGQTVSLDRRFRPEKSEAAKVALAKTLHDLNADVVGVSEIESEATLRAFNEKHLSDLGYRYLTVIKGNDQRSMDVGLLSRFPLKDITSHKDLAVQVPGGRQEKLSRDLLQATVETGGGYSFTMFLTHLKSDFGRPASSAKRLAEAGVIRKVLREFEQTHPNANYLLTGDLNATPGSETLKVLQSIHRGEHRLHDALGSVGDAPTYYKSRHRGRVDHLLLSPGMQPELVRRSARIVNTASAREASDHLPAAITIDPRREAS